MDKIFTTLRRWLSALTAVAPTPDPLSRLSLSELADLPASHPDECCCG